VQISLGSDLLCSNLSEAALSEMVEGLVVFCREDAGCIESCRAFFFAFCDLCAGEKVLVSELSYS